MNRELKVPSGTQKSLFATTRWSVVLAARGAVDAAADWAIETLCLAYWRPVYVYVKRRGHTATDAEDLTQEFFFRLLQRNYLAHADPLRGRFRSFLLTAVNHFLANEKDRIQAVKRGGRVSFIRFEEINGDDWICGESSASLSPEEWFERNYATALLGKVLARLRGEFADRGKLDLFEKLKSSLGGSKTLGPYAALAAELGTTEAALKMMVKRMRERYAELLREEIASTVKAPEEVEDEIHHLFRVLETR